MSVLVIHQGNENLQLEPSRELTYSYRIGAGRILGRDCVNLNDAAALNRISRELRDKYVSWIYGFNKEFIASGLIWEETSLFFLSDLSNKRNELFDTYNTLSVLTLLKEALDRVRIDAVLLDGVDQSFAKAVRSAFPCAEVQLRNPRPASVSLPRRVLADIRFCMLLTCVAVLNKVLGAPSKPRSGVKRRFFFSFFPQTFDDANVDIRYGGTVGTEDRYLVAMMADGMHQQLGLIAYLKNQIRIRGEKHVVIDNGIKISDLLLGLKIWWNVYRFNRDRTRSSDVCLGIDISGYIYEELIWSTSRVARLIVFSRALERVVSTLEISELVYIVFEYPLGRAISGVLGRKFQEIKRVGFNHGEYSWRFVNYFLDKREPSVTPPYLEHCPIPDQVLAEDQLTAQIYKFNGYQRVEVMDVVERLHYLKKVVPNNDSSNALIVAGLHDGPDLLKAMIHKIRKDQLCNYFFRPHPRARNSYLENIVDLPSNLTLDTSPIHEVMSQVGKVYLTYSGLGYEVATLGIQVVVVLIPGRIAWSKCIDAIERDHRAEGGSPLPIELFSPGDVV